MTGRVYEFPSGHEKAGSSWLRRWSVISALVRQLGVKQEPVQEIEGVVTQTPVFTVELHSFGHGTPEPKICTSFVTIGVPDLHAMLHLIIHAANSRGDSISITDYTRGVAQLPEEYAIENQR